VTPEQEQQATALMIRAQQGDRLAYAELLTLLAAMARRYTRNRVGDVPWLDDVVQETLVTIHGARQTYDSNRPLAPWFYAILSSRMIDVLRRERRVRTREVGADELPEPNAVTFREPRDAVDFGRVKAALEALPERQREIVTALKLRDESVKEISARMGMSPSAVKVTAHRAYRALRRALGGGDRED
jgi:RNA polymerase sigma-70 factor, ECF subfamily